MHAVVIQIAKNVCVGNGFLHNVALNSLLQFEGFCNFIDKSAHFGKSTLKLRPLETLLSLANSQRSEIWR